MKRYLLSALTVMLLVSGCFKDVEENTRYLLKPLVQYTSGGVNEPLEGVFGYAFEADTTEWTVLSWEEAVHGIISRKDNPSEQLAVPLAEALPSTLEGMENRIELSLPPRSVMLLMVDPANRLYAYTQVEMKENIGNLYVTLIFKPWKEASSWKEGWSFYNPFFEPTITVESFVKVAAESAPSGAQETIPQVKVMAFAADTTEWRIASYDDAVGGMLTSKQDSLVTRSNPEFNGYETNEKGTFRMKVSASPLMVVVVDRTHRLYAYSKQTIDFTDPTLSPTFSLLFPLWQTSWITEQEGWRVVNPEYEPAEEQTPATE